MNKIKTHPLSPQPQGVPPPLSLMAPNHIHFAVGQVYLFLAFQTWDQIVCRLRVCFPVRGVKNLRFTQAVTCDSSRWDFII